LINLVCDSYSRSLRISILSTSKLSVTFWLGSTLTFNILARFANISVEIVSPRYCRRGLIFARSFVLELPPSESFRKNVNLESRKGTYFFFFIDSTNELMTFPKQWSDLLILHPSLRRYPEPLT
jgi:hypothetical protein